MPPQREAFFLGTAADRRFCVLSRPTGRPVGALLHIHAFAEELNRSRRMVALASKAFAEQGWTVLQMDAHGCGDSEGDFGDATWDSWVHDIDRAHAWLADDTPGPMALWSHRAGSLLAANWLARTAHSTVPLLAWQPVLQGKQYLTQFLRIRLGADLAQSPEAKNVLTELRASLHAGERASIGGYWLSPALAEGLENAAFTLPAGHTGPVTALEVASGDRPEPTPALRKWLEGANAKGLRCQGQAVQGHKFWQSKEVETALALVEPSLAALRSWTTS
jgi:exosortase A-associated hydrolase 2